MPARSLDPLTYARRGSVSVRFIPSVSGPGFRGGGNLSSIIAILEERIDHMIIQLNEAYTLLDNRTISRPASGSADCPYPPRSFLVGGTATFPLPYFVDAVPDKKQKSQHPRNPKNHFPPSGPSGLESGK